jgi:uncharacterized protein YndB with AHSA1/START domain
MTAQTAPLTVTKSITVDAPPDRAFAVFTTGMSTWWPMESHHIGENLAVEVVIEPRAGGRWFERAADGSECDWGRVLTWDPPRRLVFTWQIGPGREPVPDPDRASEVEVRFRDERVELTHRGFERHGPSGGDYRKALSSPEGWPMMLNRFKAYLENQ